MYAAVDWNAVGAIGQWAAAIATFAAVVVALRVARRASSIRIKVKVSLALRQELSGPSLPIVTFDAVNFSQWPVKVTSIGFRLPNGNEGTAPALLKQPPLEAQPLQQISVAVPQRDLAFALRANQFQPGSTLGVYFADSTGKRHWYRWKNCRPDQWDK